MSGDGEVPMGALRVDVMRKTPCLCAETENPGYCDGEDCDPGHHACGWCDGDAWIWRDVDLASEPCGLCGAEPDAGERPWAVVVPRDGSAQSVCPDCWPEGEPS